MEEAAVHRKIYEMLERLGIEFQKFEHEAVFTCEEAAALPPMPGVATKNLFLRDRKGRQHFLVTAAADTAISLKELGDRLGCTGLSLASPERLAKYLKVIPGAVSPLALVHDEGREITFVVDEKVLTDELIGCHPGVNTATLVISTKDLQRFLLELGYSLNLMSTPTP